MNNGFSNAAYQIEEKIREKIISSFTRIQKESPNHFSREAIIKRSVDNGFDDEKTINELFELFITVIYNEAFK